MNQTRVYGKTEAGFDEVQSRRAGLNARVRQLLILVDGKRSVSELGKMMALAELEEFLALLELKGLILLKQHEGGSSAVPNHENGPPSTGQESSASRSPPGVKLAISDFREVDGSVAVATQIVKGNEGADVGQSEAVRIKVDRINMSKLLQATVGPLADDLCVRIERATRHSELSDLFTAAVTVVELMSGRKAAANFAEKMKQKGWEA